MEFRLLGPVEATIGGEPVELGRRRERALLAVLLLEVGQPVPIQRLIDLLFEANPVRDPRKALQIDASRLRRSLAAAGPDVRLAADAAGYTLYADPESVDVHGFRVLVDRGQQTSDAPERSRLLREALSLWRGSVLADLGDGTQAATMRTRLEEMRLTALQLRVEADLDAGRHDELVAELADLTAQHPTSERLVAAQMLALYRCGRKRDALDVYQRTASQMADQLGLDPGPQLRETHLAILRDDAELAAPTSTPASAAPVVRPAQLPADLPSFTGRDDELASLLARCRLPHETVVATAIDGMAGVGKTTLAVHLAHRLKADYPDGQLFIDLHGFTEGVEPLPPGEALGRLLRSLGVPDAQIPQETEDQAALYRSVLAEKRVLIVLDNAAAESQVRPLLPAHPGCLALITSRHQLAGLDQATSLSLDSMPVSDAVALFTHVAGPDRIVDEPADIVHDVIGLCGRLPLAIRIAGARLGSRPAWNLPYLADRLRDEHRRLDELEVGSRDIASAFRLSYEQLRNHQRRMFRLLAVHGGHDVDTDAAAALAGWSVREAERSLDDLQDVHLIQQPSPGRYQFHDLLRTYATTRAAAEETELDWKAGLTRVLDYYTYAAAIAMDVLYADESSRRPAIAEPASATPTLSDPTQARRWLDNEWNNMRVVAGRAADYGLAEYLVRTSQLLWRHLHTRGRFAEASNLHSRALTTARETGDTIGQVRALLGLGRSHHKAGRHDLESDLHIRALNLARRAGHALGEIDALNGLGRVHQIQGPYDTARDYYRRAHELARDLGDYRGEIIALTGLAHLHSMLGRHDQAAESFERGLRLAEDAGDDLGEIDMLNGLARAHLRTDDLPESRRLLERSLELASRLGNPLGKVQSLNGLAQTYLGEFEYDRAIAFHREVFEIASEIGDRNYEFEGLLGIGLTQLAAGDPSSALATHRQALEVACELDQQYDVAAAREAVGQALHDLGRVDEAREHWHRALEIFTELAVPDAERVRERLSALDESTRA